MLLLHPKEFSYGVQSGYPLENTVKELKQENDWAIVVSPSRVYLAAMKKIAHIDEESVVKQKTVYLSINSGNGANLR